MRNLFVFTLLGAMVLSGANAVAEKKKRAKEGSADQSPAIEEIGPDDKPKPMNAQRVAPVVVVRPESSAAQEAAAAPAEATEVAPEPSAKETRVPEAKKGSVEVKVGRFPVGPIILGSVGVVAIVIGAGTGWQADQEYDMYKEKRSNSYPYATNALADDIKLHTAVANGMMISGLAVVAASVIWGVVEGVVVVKKQEKEKKTGFSARWRPSVRPNGTGVTVKF